MAIFNGEIMDFEDREAQSRYTSAFFIDSSRIFQPPVPHPGNAARRPKSVP
jgi:hypothetical protein